MENKKIMKLVDRDPKLLGPVAFVIKRGRRGRGFIVSTFDNPEEPIPCADKSDLSDAIVEILDDASQGRVEFDGPDDSGEASSKGSTSDARSEQPEESEDDGIFAGVRNADDPADRLIFNVVSAAIKKGQDISSGGSSSRSRRRSSKRRGPKGS